MLRKMVPDQKPCSHLEKLSKLQLVLGKGMNLFKIPADDVGRVNAHPLL